MSILNISIPYLTTSNLPNLIQGPNIPGSYAILLFIALNFTFTTRHIHNRSTFPLWPSLFILSGAISNCPPLFPSSILDTFWPWNSSSSVIYFFLFILFMRFSRKEYWSGLPFPSPVDHVLSELSTLAHPSWVALHDMADSSTELDKAVVHVISLISFLWLWFSFCLPSDG